MKTKFKLLGIGLLVFFMFSFFLMLNFAVGQTDSVDSKVQVANDAVNKAFNDVVAAEKAGTNVTSLLNQLNVVQALLAQAEMKVRLGDPASAARVADSVVPIAQQVSSAAQAAQATASVNAQNAFWSTIALSVVGSVVFVLALFFVWRRFRRGYVERLSGAKPELTSLEWGKT